MADSTIILEESLAIFDDIQAGKLFTIQLSELLSAEPLLGPSSTTKRLSILLNLANEVSKKFTLCSLTTGWYLFLSDLVSLRPQKSLSETLELTDSIDVKRYFTHETWEVKIFRGGTEQDVDQTNIESFNFTKVLSDEVGSGEVVFENSDNLDFREGDEIRIYYASEDVGVPSLIFTGEIDLAERFWDEEEATQKLKLSFQDYGKLLLEKKITASFPTVTNVNDILDSILAGYQSPHSPVYPNERKLDLTEIYDYTATRTVDFVGESLWDCLNKLAFITRSEFYVDQDKKLQFFRRTYQPINGSLTIDEFEDYNYERKDDMLVNTIDVYGHQNKILPVPTEDDPDPWCEYYDINLWSNLQGARYADTIAVRAGEYSICNDHLSSSPMPLNLAIMFPSVMDLSRKDSFKEIVFSSKIISGCSLTAFPQADLVFELYDTNSNRMIYPAGQAFDLIETYENPTTVDTWTSASPHTFSATSYGGAHDGTTITCTGTERIAFNYVRDVIRNRWYGHKGYSKMTYQFGSGAIHTIVEDETEDPAEVPYYEVHPTELWSNDLSWTNQLALNMNAPSDWSRVRVTHAEADYYPNSGPPVYVHIRFRLDWDGGAPLTFGGTEWGGAAWTWLHVTIDDDEQGDPGQDAHLWAQMYRDWGTNNFGIKNYKANFSIGTTAALTVEPNIYAVGGLGETLIIKFYGKSATSGKDVISTNRAIRYIKSSGVIPGNLVEVRVPVGPDAVVEGKWELDPNDSTFDWSNVMQFNVQASVSWSGGDDDWAKLVIDWLHFDKGKWFDKASDTTSMAEPPTGYGIRFKEIFDDTIYSDTAAGRWADEMILRYKNPLFNLRNVTGLLDGLESYDPGDRFIISLPETGGTLTPYYYFLRRIYFEYDEEEGTSSELDFERIGAV